MKSDYYAHFLPKDFDNYDCVKLSPVVYLILLFVLRGYIVWIMSVTNMRDHVGIIQWIYPETALFYLSLFSGMIGLFIVLVLSLRRPNAAPWIRACWKKCQTLLILALVFDLIISFLGYFYWQLQSVLWLTIQSTLVISSIFFIHFSKRFALNLLEFPEEIPEK
jgi:hypothetical protein